jgi:hypothetical protein
MGNKWTLINTNTGQVHTFTTKRDMISFIKTWAPTFDLWPDRKNRQTYYIERNNNNHTGKDNNK